MLLLWVAAEDFWERPRPAGFGSEAVAPGWKDEQSRTRIYDVMHIIIYTDLSHCLVPSLHPCINLWTYLPLHIFLCASIFTSSSWQIMWWTHLCLFPGHRAPCFLALCLAWGEGMGLSHHRSPKRGHWTYPSLKAQCRAPNGELWLCR